MALRFMVNCAAFCRGHHLDALTFVVIKAFRPYGLYLWNDDVGRVFGHHRIEGVAVEHVNDLASWATCIAGAPG